MNYTRLTERRGSLVIDKCGNCENVSNPMGCTESMCYEIMKNRLAELEDKIEYGTLIELPCKVGDMVYWLFTTNIQQEIYECYVTEYIYNRKGLDICLSKKCLNGYAYFTLKDIGKTVFLTREEAENRLKELQE